EIHALPAPSRPAQYRVHRRRPQAVRRAVAGQVGNVEWTDDHVLASGGPGEIEVRLQQVVSDPFESGRGSPRDGAVDAGGPQIVAGRKPEHVGGADLGDEAQRVVPARDGWTEQAEAHDP